MSLIVQKYGGTSVASMECIQSVAERIIATQQQGHQLVVTVSAMAGETNRLLGLAHQVDALPEARELDMLLSAGEQVSIALLAIALNQKGAKAISLLADQVGIYTNSVFNDAKIERVETHKINGYLDEGYIVIIAGFQGRDVDNNITTLGRGGSDTTAVAIAAALNADECQIFTDVAGIYSADPHCVSDPRHLKEVAFDDMHLLAKAGAKVLQAHSVSHAWNESVNLRVLSSFENGEGTLICHEPSHTYPVTGLAIQQDLYLIDCSTLNDQQQNELSCRYRVVSSDLNSFQIIGNYDNFLQLNAVFGSKIVKLDALVMLTFVGHDIVNIANSVYEQLEKNQVDIYQRHCDKKCLEIVIAKLNYQSISEMLHTMFVITDK